jgi:hypothetical protein
MNESRHWNEAKSRASVALQSRPEGDAQDGAADNTIDLTNPKLETVLKR